MSSDALTKPDSRIDYAPLKERIRYYFGPSCNGYYELMLACFKPELHPKAWNYSSNGGPPGCAMAFGKALREMRWHYDRFRVWGPSK